MSEKLTYIVTYDVRDDKRLKKVAMKMEGFGVRIQYSVFKCKLSDREMERMKWEVTSLMKIEDDLLIIRLCCKCRSNIYHRGAGNSWDDKDEPCIII